MFFDIALYVSLAVCLLGLLWRARKALSAPLTATPSAGAAGFKSIFLLRPGRVLRVLILDCLLQVRLLMDSPLRWAMHMAIFGGFIGLTLMHALGDQVMPLIDPDYAATLNPYLWLRNLFGLICLAGLAVAAWRRLLVPGIRRTSDWYDAWPLILLAVILLSGFGLEGLKIASPTRYEQMAEDYGDFGDDEEEMALRTFWALKYGVAFPRGTTLDADSLEDGAELNDDQCAACHSDPRHAWLSWPLSRVLAGLARSGDGAETSLWYIHWLAVFLGLALLPFTKFIHIVATPLSLMAERKPDEAPAAPGVEAFRRTIQAGGCVHCGQCSARCSVVADWLAWSNPDVLPSEKLISIKALARGEIADQALLDRLAAGSHACTSCGRCSEVCPAGIDLQSLWLDSKAGLSDRGLPPVVLDAREKVTAPNRNLNMATGYLTPPMAAGLPPEIKARPNDFHACFTCLTCSNSCPVVAAVEDPAREIGLMPHQIMHCLGLGLVEEALGADMIWDCLTCYHCQEACPQQVAVADLLYDLRNLACDRAADQGGPR